ncbi:hypothetical protein JOM56_011227 [Amanita muscaria]
MGGQHNEESAWQQAALFTWKGSVVYCHTLSSYIVRAEKRPKRDKIHNLASVAGFQKKRKQCGGEKLLDSLLCGQCMKTIQQLISRELHPKSPGLANGRSISGPVIRFRVLTFPLRMTDALKWVEDNQVGLGRKPHMRRKLVLPAMLHRLPPDCRRIGVVPLGSGATAFSVVVATNKTAEVLEMIQNVSQPPALKSPGVKTHYIVHLEKRLPPVLPVAGGEVNDGGRSFAICVEVRFNAPHSGVRTQWLRTTLRVGRILCSLSEICETARGLPYNP